MQAILKIFTAVVLCAGLTATGLTGAKAQELSALARVVPGTTTLTQSRHTVTLEVGLSQGVPYRLYTLADPNQLVIELSEVLWSGLDPATLSTRHAPRVQVGTLAPGWSGLVMDLDGPFEIYQASVTDFSGQVVLRVELRRSSEAAYRAASGVPETAAAILRGAAAPAPRSGDFIVVIDPGHGGVDPGAERDGVNEADLMLIMARELRDALRRLGGFEVHLTRDEDRFVSLPARAGLARELGADAFVSLHADALETGYAEGATAHTLSEGARASATALLTERQDRSEILSGVDLGGQDDEIATVLLDLARQDSGPRSAALAKALVAGMGQAGARINNNPQRSAHFAVLRSADVPSVLVEVGFLSSDRDRIELQSPERRGRIVRGLAQGLKDWAEADRAQQSLRRH